MVFSDFKEVIKACDSENLIIKDFFFSCLTILSYLLEFFEILLNLRKFSMSSLSKISSDNIKEFMIKEFKNLDHTQEFNLHSVPSSDTN